MTKIWTTCALLLAACGGAPPRTPPETARPPEPTRPRSAPAPPAPEAPPDPFPTSPGDPPWVKVRSKRFQVSFPLPDRGGWTLVREGGSFSVMEHPETQSTLVLRRWRPSHPMNREECEASARLLRALPKREGGLIDRRILDVPSGFDTRVDVGARTTGAGAVGWLLAFGAAGRECFAFVFETQADGPSAEASVADRLAVMQSRVLPSVEIHRDTAIDDQLRE